MATKRVKDTSEIGRALNDNDLLFVTKTNENTDNNSTYDRIKKQIASYATGITETIYNTKTGMSNGVIEFSGITLASSTTFNVAPVKGWILDSYTNAPINNPIYVEYPGGNGLTTPFMTADTATYIMLTSGATLEMQTTNPTLQQRRQNLYLGKIGHGTMTTLLNAFSEPDVFLSPMSQVRDIFSTIKFINDGIKIFVNSGLKFNVKGGTIYGFGIGFSTNPLNPTSLSITDKTPATFQYRTQSGGSSSNTTNVDPTKYDNNGVVTGIGDYNYATNQRVYLTQNGTVRIQYGQTTYVNLYEAIIHAQSENFETFINFKDNAILIGIISVIGYATDLSDINQAYFLPVSKIGEPVVGITPVIKDSNVITVGDTGTDFFTIESALNSITDNSEANKYIISVAPGVFYENEIYIKPNVSIIGASILSTIVIPNGNHNLFTLTGCTSEISFLTISGVTSGYAAINVDDAGNYNQCHKVSFYDCDTNIKVISKTKDTYFYAEYIDFNGTYTNGIHCQDINESFILYCNAENYYNLPTIAQCFNKSIGTNSKLDILASGNVGSGVENGFCAISGGTIDIMSSYLENAVYGFHTVFGGNLNSTGCILKECNKGIYSESASESSEIKVSAEFINCIEDIRIDSLNTSGYFTGIASHEKIFINENSPFYIVGKDQKIITVAKKGADHTSIKDAYDSISGQSETNRYLVSVGPGFFTEDEIQMRPYIDIEGSGRFTTIISASNPSNHVFLACDNSSIHKLRLEGSLNTSAIYTQSSFSSTTDYAYGNAITFGENKILIEVDADQYPTVFLLNDAEIGRAHFDQAFKISNNVSYSATSAIRLYDVKMPVGAIPSYPSEIVYGGGVGTELTATACRFSTGGYARGGNGLYFYDGIKVRINAVNISGFQTGITIANIGAGPDVRTLAFALEDNIMDIYVDNPYAIGNIFGGADVSKVYVDPSSTIGLQYNETSDGTIGTVTIGDIYQGLRQDRIINLSELAIDSATMGLDEGGELSKISGRTLSVEAGYGYLITSSDYLKRVEWVTTPLTVPSGATSYIEVNENGVINANLSKGDDIHSIKLGSVFTRTNSIHYLENTPTRILHIGNRTIDFLNSTLGVIYESGSIVAENGVRQLDVTQGTRYYNLDTFTSSGGTPVIFEEHWRIGDGTYHHGPTTATTVDNSQYDMGSGLTAMTSGYYTKHSLYVTGGGGEAEFLFMYGQAEYSGLTEVQNASLPIPPNEFIDSTCIIASIITREGEANIIQINDERPRIGFNASSIASTLLHSNLQGLGADDHTQYFLTNGGRVMEGTFNMGTYNIISAGTINGVVIEDHSSRHLPNGLDPLTSAAPTANIGNGSQNSVGIQNSFSRSDHSHKIVTASTSTYGQVKLSSTQEDAKVVSDTDPRINAVLGKVNSSGDTMTGGLIVPSISATSITATTFYGDGGQLSNIYTSAGLINDVIYINNGDGTLTLGQINVAIYDNSIFTGSSKSYIVAPAVTTTTPGSLQIVDETTNYIIVDYNFGTPIYKVIQDVELITESSVIPVITIYRHGIYLHNLNWDSLGVGLANKINQRLVKVDRIARESGLIISTSAGTGTASIGDGIVVTEGKSWNGGARQYISQSESLLTASTTTFFCYQSGNTSNWQVETGHKGFNNTQFWNSESVNISGLTDGYYTNNWVYKGIEDYNHIYIVPGERGQFQTLSDASRATSPASLPQIITSHAILVGRIIAKKGEAASQQTDSAFVKVFALGSSSDHNSMINLQGGAASDYYHITSAQHYLLTENNDASSIHNHNSSYLNLSGGTISGNILLQTISATTIISGSTNLYNIFSTTDNNDITRVQPGSNITTGGTGNAPTINLAASPSVNGFTASGNTSLQTVSATTIISGSTNLYNIFSTTDTNDITRIQPGSNITTGGTGNAPTVSLVASPSVNSLTASGNTSLQTVSATTIISGSTNLYNIFVTPTSAIGANYQATPIDPTATSSAVGVMMGLAGSITPTKSGNIIIYIVGDCDESANSRGCAMQIRTGTGVAPANAAALTGTARGSLINMAQNNSTIRTPFACCAMVTGLSVGTPYWIDLSLAAVGGSGNARVRNISISAMEQ